MARPKPIYEKQVQLFWSRVDVNMFDPNSCWEWQAYKHSHGYGEMRFMGKLDYAHRIAYRVEHGDIPSGLEVLHTCDNPSCCNPSHLRVGTHAENVQQMVERGRHGSRRAFRFPENQIKLIRHLQAQGFDAESIAIITATPIQDVSGIMKGKKKRMDTQP